MMNNFEPGKFYKHKVSDSIYYCVGMTPRWRAVLMRTQSSQENEEHSPYIIPPEAYNFYEEL